MLYRLGLILLALVVLALSFTPTQAGPVPYSPRIRLYSTMDTLTSPACGTPVSGPTVVNYVEPGESKYQVRTQGAGAGVWCLQVGIDGPPIQTTCLPICQSLPCVLTAPVVGPPGTLNTLSVSVTGEAPPGCVLPALVWDYQISVSP